MQTFSGWGGSRVKVRAPGDRDSDMRPGWRITANAFREGHILPGKKAPGKEVGV